MTTRLAATDLGTIVSIWAHPDDETYLAGGLMAAAADAGQRVVCVSATAGERGTDDPVTWPPDRLGRVRRWEAAAAMAVLGVADHRFLDLPDGGLADLDPDVGVSAIAALLTEVRPDTVVTFAADGATFHPDHVAVSAWVEQAWAELGRPGRLLQVAATTSYMEQWGPSFEEWGIYMTDDRPVGVDEEDAAVLLRLDGAALDRKVAALTAMATQVGPAVALLGPERFCAHVAEECFMAVDR